MRLRKSSLICHDLLTPRGTLKIIDSMSIYGTLRPLEILCNRGTLRLDGWLLPDGTLFLIEHLTSFGTLAGSGLYNKLVHWSGIGLFTSMVR